MARRRDWPAELAGVEAEIVGEAPGAPAPALAKFDPRTVWEGLAPEARERLGLAAITLAYVLGGASRVDGRRALGFEAAETAALAAIAGAPGFLPGFLQCVNIPPVWQAPALPDLAVIGVRACTVCGCTDMVCCPEGCIWVEPQPDSGPLCTACAGERLAPW